uniref:T9SS type A sorting domain-containing protein n=2 Tax=candidate division WOR-3 bacterium TaxID=2052148 RepID=A0A7C3EV91_UNCW3
MMSLAILFLLSAAPGGWQTFTNSNFIADLCGDDSVLNAATLGGVVILETKPEIRVRHHFYHTDGLGVNRCLGIARDPEGNLWVGTDGAGLAVIPADSVRARLYRAGELPLRIRAVAVDSGRVLLGTEQGVYVVELRGSPLNFDDDRVEHYSFARVRELLSDRVLAIAAGPAGYWIGTNQGLTQVDQEFSRWRAFRRPLGDSVSAIALLSDGRIVAGTELGLVVGDTGGLVPIVTFAQAKAVRDLAVTGSSIYLATADTLFQVDSSGTMVPLLLGDIRSLCAGAVLWAGLGGNDEWGLGLRYLRSGQSWESYYFNGVASGMVSDCALGKDGSIYVGHHSSYISRIKPDSAVQLIVSPLSWAVQVRCDSRGRLWFSHFYPGGLSVYDPDADTWGSRQLGSGDRNVVQAFGLDRHDTKWVFNKSGSVVAIDSLGREAEFYLPELVPPPGGNYEFAFDSRDRVWVGLTNGLEEFDYNGTLFYPGDDRHALHSEGLPASEVRSVAVDPQDRVWVATPQGGAMWDGSRFQVYTTSNSRLLSNNLYRVRVDGGGRVWFLSDLGLSIFDVATGSWTNYTAQNSGLIPNSQSLTGFYTALALDDQQGVAVIGTARGVSVFSYAPEPDSGVSGLKIFPNPFVFGVHRGVVVANLPSDARVRVYTLSGMPVAELPVSPGLGRAYWVPDKTGSGIYLVVASSRQGIITERLALVNRGQ